MKGLEKVPFFFIKKFGKLKNSLIFVLTKTEIL